MRDDDDKKTRDALAEWIRGEVAANPDGSRDWMPGALYDSVRLASPFAGLTDATREIERATTRLDDAIARLAGAADGVDVAATTVDDRADRLTETAERLVQQGTMLIDATEAARVLGITPKALYARVQRRQVPAACVVQTGRRIQFHRDRLRTYGGRTK